MRKFRRNVVHLGLLSLTVPLLLFSTACKKEEPRATSSPAQDLNQLSNETVFDEVLKKVKENPKDAEALYHLADLYDRSGQYPEAIENYKKVIALKPDMGYAYFKMGTAYDRLNQPAEAVTALKKATSLMPKNAIAFNNLGVAYGKLGRLDDEIASLQRAIKIRSAYSSARYNLGLTYLKKGNKKAAMKEYENLKNFDEGTAEALLQEINHTQ